MTVLEVREGDSGERHLFVESNSLVIKNRLFGSLY